MRFVTNILFLLGLMGLSVSATWGRPEDPHKITCITSTSATVTADTCQQGVGSISLAHDGIAPFTYEWSHDSSLNAPLATGLTPDSYTIVVTDSAGCVDSLRVGVGRVDPLNVTINQNNIVPDTCGTGVGAAFIELSDIENGTAPYSFEWGDDTTLVGPSVSGLVAGTYEVTVTDDLGCRGIATVVVSNNLNGFAATTEVFSVGCNGDSSGGAVVRVSGGSSLNTFLWYPLGDTSNVLSTDTLLSDVATGNYVIEVNGGSTGGGGCGYSLVLNVPEPTPLVADVEQIPSTECLVDDGIAIATPRGGTPPYRYEWSNGATGDSALELQADFYSLFVTDTNDCRDTTRFVLPSEPGPFFDIEVLQEDNCGLGEGIARVRVDSGKGPFEYIWGTLPPQPDSQYAYNLIRRDPSTLNPYAVAVRTIDSCIVQKNFYMPGNDPLTIEVTEQEDNYCELANGRITVNVQGGTEPYSYRWSSSPPVLTSTITGLEAGTYTVTVLDSFNCDIAQTVTLIDELGFTLDVETTDETCYGDEDGAATAVLEGGRSPFTFDWDSEPTQRTQEAVGLPGGVYNVTVVDADGCERRAFGEVRSQTFLDAIFTSTPGIEEERVESNATFEFFNESLGGDRYEWDFDDGNTSTQVSPIHTYSDSGTYFVTLRAFNLESGCVDSLLLGPYRVLADGTVFIPNAFTPNDDRLNDLFTIKGELIETFDLQIFSRWGTVIFTSQSQDDQWDGTLPNGGPAPVGTYVYRLEAITNGGRPVSRTGTVFLLR